MGVEPDMDYTSGLGLYVYHPEYGGRPGPPSSEDAPCEDCGGTDCVHRLDPEYDPSGRGGGDLCHDCAERRTMAAGGEVPDVRRTGQTVHDP